jgi:hypothetical protein
MRVFTPAIILQLALACAAGGAVVAPASARAQARDSTGPLLTSSDQQRRREAAGQLRAQGFDVDWRLATWVELHDWTLRAAEARLLRERFGVTVDWRAFALGDMRAWEGRIARAQDLRRFGVDADWRLYTERQLDDLRAFLERARAEAPRSAPRAQDLVPPEVTLGFDPDAILVPTYVTEELARAETDDAILEPAFSRRPRKPHTESAPAGAPSPANAKAAGTPSPAPAPGSGSPDTPGKSPAAKPSPRALKAAPPAQPALPAPPAPAPDLEPARL